MDLDARMSCHRCGRVCDLSRLDTDLWLVLDARPDGWVLLVCRLCQTPAEEALAWSIRIDDMGPSRRP